MNRQQHNKQDMHVAVRSHMESDPTQWEASTPAVTCIDNIRRLIGEIDRQRRIQEALAPKALAEAKRQRREAMNAAATVLIQKARPFARRTGDVTLLRVIDFSPSELGVMAERRAIDRCLEIHDALAPRLAHLEPYRVTQADLDALSAAVEALVPLTGDGETSRNQAKAATKALRALFDEASEELSLLDDLVPTVASDPAFVTAYFEARRIYDRRNRGSGPLT